MVGSMYGKIIKGVGGFYTVLTSDGSTVVCKARGLFRKLGLVPLPGDNVVFSIDSKGGGYLLEILERSNELLRPAVANVDVLLIVISAGDPIPDLELVDKLLLYCAKQCIRPVLVINKCDQDEPEAASRIILQYKDAIDDILTVSAKTGRGVDKLEGMLSNRTVCFAGQSAVGKSSLINLLLGLDLKTGELSAKTDRGRHTTRHAELIPTPYGGLAVDTPGFSMLESVPLEPEEIPKLYRAFNDPERTCRFLGCMHMSEPGCSVKDGVACGRINKERYERYVKIASEAIEARRHRYD